MMRRWWWGVVAASLLLVGVLVGCQPLLERLANASVDAASGRVMLPGLAAPATVRRDVYGVPLIEAASEADLAYAMGYVMAEDRLAQMVSYSLTAQGRLAEMAGPVAVDLDVYTRTLGLRRRSEAQWQSVPADLKALLQRFAAGVNAYVDGHKARLPLEFRLSGYTPEPWTPLNSLDIFTVLNLGLSLNAHEELAFLALAARVGTEKAAWLIPSYPDEPLAFDEAAKLHGVDLRSVVVETRELAAVQAKMRQTLLPVGVAASNNWVVAPGRTRGGASILANDTHLMLEHPPVWMLMQVRAPGLQAGGVAMAGLPGIVAGTNGKVAWGMTMVMADSQDIYLEQLRQVNGRTEYRYRDGWRPVTTREEVIRVKDGEPVRITVEETGHGPLLNRALRGRHVNELLPPRLLTGDRWGLAMAMALPAHDQSLVRFFSLAKAQSVAAAQTALRELGFIHLNMVLADREHIAWQVTGAYPERARGRGYFPSPGWTGDYDWTGYVPYARLPQSVDPVQGFIATANHRTTSPNDPHLTDSWYAPERFDRIEDMLRANATQDTASTIAMQNDVMDLTVRRGQQVFKRLGPALEQALAHVSAADQERAQQALARLQAFDGQQAANSADAALWGLFLDRLTKELFLDELGPDGGEVWRAFLIANAVTYSAQQDHLYGRDDSPFWDDINTPVREGKADILARALAGAWQVAEARLGKEPAQWRWGDLHTYHWRTGSTKLRPFLPSALERWAVGRLGEFTDRGPYPAPGSTNTVNVAGYTVGENFDVWNVPAMRMIVNFAEPEPLQILITGGQSGNPGSPHFTDGIDLFLSGRNRPMPLAPETAHAHFAKVLNLEPSSSSERLSAKE